MLLSGNPVKSSSQPGSFRRISGFHKPYPAINMENPTEYHPQPA